MKHDFYFGTYYTRELTNQPSMGLYELVEKARMSGRQHFTAQLRRFLAQNGTLVATDGTSAPPFPRFLQYVDTSEIGLVRIGGRTDVNGNTGTLDCTLIFVEGPMIIEADWCAWKEIRAYEIIDTLLAPLITTNLIERTVICKEGREHPVPSDHASMVRELFSLTGEPYSTTAHGGMDGYLKRIEQAYSVEQPLA